MRRYEKYKDSCIEWIGEIPEHWSLQKCKYLFKEHTGNGFPEDMQGETSGNIPFYKVSDLNGLGIYVNESNNYVSFEDIELKKWNIIPKGSILTAKIGEALRKNHRKICTGDCIVDNNCLGLEPQGVDYKYAFYILKTVDFDWFVNPGAVPSVSMDKLRSFFIPITTNPDEQTAIANYLDKKTTEIDELIKLKVALLLLFEEEKIAIINHAVTRGINPNTKLKDSGIDWIGEIPVHWEVKRLRYFGNCQNGISQSADYFGSGFPFVSYGDVYKNQVLPNEVEGLANSTDTDRFNYSVIQGDVFFTRTSETIEEIGIASTCLKSIENAVFSGFLIRFRPFNKDLFDGFSKYYFRAQIHRKFFVKEMNLVTRASLSQELLKKMPVVILPFQEQIEIAIYLDSILIVINTKIESTKKQIELLIEYKTALISEVATGKVKVN